jgi:hypothetical protein
MKLVMGYQFLQPENSRFDTLEFLYYYMRSNMEHSGVQAPSNVFAGDWVSRLDTISQRSFLTDTKPAYINKFASHAHVRGVDGNQISKIMDTALISIHEQGLSPLDTHYCWAGFEGSVSVVFRVNCDLTHVTDHSFQMIDAIVRAHEDTYSDLISFNLLHSTMEDKINARKTA